MLCGICLSPESVNIEIGRSSAQQPERKTKAHAHTTGSQAPRFHRITTNLDYDDWLNFLGNKYMATALLSRLRHQCTTIKIDGPSLREPQG